MIDTPSLALAFAAGFVSFVSPCCLPLVPGYLATVGGTQPGSAVDRRVIGRSLLFVGTFSLLFVLFGLGATAIGALLFSGKAVLTKVAGLVIIAMGALFIGSVFATGLNREWRPPGLVERAGRGGPVVAGAAFALAWTPCVGPTLGAILGLASTQSGTAKAGLLLVVYSAGLAVPFLLSAVAFERTSRSFGFFRRHHAVVQVTAGAVLMAMGVLVATGELFQLNIQAQQLLDSIGFNFFQNV